MLLDLNKYNYFTGKHSIHFTQLLTIGGYILHKARKKKGRKHDYDVYKKNHPVIPKQFVNVIDLGISLV